MNRQLHAIRREWERRIAIQHFLMDVVVGLATDVAVVIDIVRRESRQRLCAHAHSYFRPKRPVWIFIEDPCRAAGGVVEALRAACVEGFATGEVFGFGAALGSFLGGVLVF
jgi:hypothetical protein